MKVKCKLNIMFLCISFLPLLFYSISFGAVSSKMYTKNTVAELEQFYNASNDYTRRYILRYLPNWLNKRGQPSLPSSFNTIISDALYTSDGALVREAVKLTGIYNLGDYSGRLIELYKTAHREYGVDATHIRTAVISATLKLGESYAKVALTQFLYVTPRFILEPEFNSMLRAISVYGDSTHISELTLIETMIQNDISSLVTEDEFDRAPYDYQRVLQTVKYAKEVILSRGGE